MTFDQILIRAWASRRASRPLYFSTRRRRNANSPDGKGGTFLFSAKGVLRYFNKSGRDSRVNLSLTDFARTDWQVVQPPESQEREKSDGQTE